MRRFLKQFLAVCLAASLIAMVGFVIWALWIPQPMQEALNALNSDAQVDVRSEPWLSFIPNAGSRRSGLILYPGARVDPRAYAPLGQMLAAEGITVVIPAMPLNMAIFSPGKARAVLDQTPHVDHWFIGGHSLGGTMAADFAAQNSGRISGLILLASYPLASSELAKSKMPVLSIYGSSDGVATVSEVTGAKPDLPPHTKWLEIGAAIILSSDGMVSRAVTESRLSHGKSNRRK